MFAQYTEHLRRFRLPFVIAFYLLSIPASYGCAFVIRFGLPVPDRDLLVFFNTLPFLFFSRLVVYSLLRTYSSSWQCTSLQDVGDIVKAGVSGSVLFMALVAFSGKMYDFPRSTLPLEGVINILIIAGTRLLFRYCYEGLQQMVPHKTNKRVLIVGAGAGGMLALREMKRNDKLGIIPVGFIDDNPYLKGTKRDGIPVLGDTKDMPHLVLKYAIDEAVIAIPSAAHKDIVRMTEICRSAAPSVRVMPSVGKFIQGEAYTGHLKEVLTNDLLGRKVIKFSRESDRILMEQEIKGQSVLITGAGGSIGSELCRQVALYHPRLVILYERYETSLYDLEIDMRKHFKDQPILPILGDILDTKKVEQVLQSHKVTLIYHAAAYKHVPVMEREPLEAVRNNIFGTFRLGEIAMKHHVKKFIMISTDKAVKPSSVMGMTKRVAELIVQSLNGIGNLAPESTQFISVRFGNVIGSNGSVIPLFKKQIAEGGPVTVTHIEMTRYFMAISEAVQLVLTAGAMGKGGEIFLLNMGEPIKILDVAEALIKRSGLEHGRDIDIVFSGIRPGEKLHEELYWAGEGVVPTKNKNITLLKPDNMDHSKWLERVNMLELDVALSNTESVMRQIEMLVNDASINVESSVEHA